jgi:hypothetical protein
MDATSADDGKAPVGGEGGDEATVDASDQG